MAEAFPNSDEFGYVRKSAPMTDPTQQPSREARRTPQRVLLTGGRAPATLELARLFARAGHGVVVAESFPSHVCRYSRSVERAVDVPSAKEDCDGYVRALTDAIVDERIDLLIPTCEEVFYVARHLEELGQHCRVFCEDLGRLEPLHNKHRFTELVAAMGQPTPKTLLLKPEGDREAELARWLDRENPPGFVLKPAYGRFGASVHFFPDGLTGKRRLPALDGRPWIAQEYVRGTAYCTYSVVWKGELAAHATYPVRFTAGGSAVSFRPVVHAQIEEWLMRFLGAIEFTGQVGFDFVEDGQGRLFALDCNPRVTSGVHLFDDVDDFAGVFFHMPGTVLRPRSERTRCVPVAVALYGLRSVRSMADLRDWAATLVGGRDVVFRWSDPFPALHQFAALARFWRLSRRHGIRLIEATTRDIEWNGGSID